MRSKALREKESERIKPLLTAANRMKAKPILEQGTPPCPLGPSCSCRVADLGSVQLCLPAAQFLLGHSSLASQL